MLKLRLWLGFIALICVAGAAYNYYIDHANREALLCLLIGLVFLCWSIKPSLLDRTIENGKGPEYPE